MERPTRTNVRREPRCLTAAALAAGLVMILFTNLSSYGSLFLWPGVETIHLVGLFSVIAAPLLLVKSISPVRPCVPVMGWIAGFTFICFVYFAADAAAEEEILRRRLLAPLIILLAYLLFVRTDTAARTARWTMLGCVLIAVTINAYDITHPFAMIPLGSEFATLGRASGLYMNPNQAGAALVMGMALTTGLLRVWLRPWYGLIVLAGVALTLSRAAVLGWVIVIASLLFGKELRRRDCLLLAVVIAIGTWIAIEFLLPAMSTRLGFDATSLAGRLFWFFDGGSLEDFSHDERQYLANRGWEQFAANPLAGNGLGSTETWDERSSTHNLYLLLMSDFGFIGAFVLPALVIASTWRVQGESRPGVLALGVFVLLWALFSHNLLSEPFTLISIALAAALRERSVMHWRSSGEDPVHRKDPVRDRAVAR